MAKHLSARRRQLGDLARDSLSLHEISRLGLNNSELVEVGANAVVDALEKSGCEIPYALTVSSSEQGSVYRHVRCAFFAEELFQNGFREVSAVEGLTGILQRVHYKKTFRAMTEIRLDQYIYWLLRKDGRSPSSKWPRPRGSRLSVLDSLMSLDDDYTFAHAAAIVLGLVMSAKGVSNVTELWDREYHTLPTAFIGQYDNCKCGCSKSGCSPCTIYMSFTLALRRDGEPYARRLLSILATTYLAEANALEFIRYFTFKELDCRHTCCWNALKARFFGLAMSTFVDESERLPRNEADIDRDGIRQEDEEKLNLLESLMNEFETKFQRRAQLESGQILSRFMQSYWTPRMKDELSKRKLQLSELAKIRAVGVDLVLSDSKVDQFYMVSLSHSEISDVESEEDLDSDDRKSKRRYAAVGRAIDRVCGWDDFGGQKTEGKRRTRRVSRW